MLHYDTEVRGRDRENESSSVSTMRDNSWFDELEVQCTMAERTREYKCLHKSLFDELEVKMHYEVKQRECDTELNSAMQLRNWMRVQLSSDAHAKVAQLEVMLVKNTIVQHVKAGTHRKHRVVETPGEFVQARMQTNSRISQIQRHPETTANS